MSSEHPWYRSIDADIADRTRADVGFTNLLSTRPYPMSPEALRGYQDRHAALLRYLTISRDLLLASVRGEADPAIADTLLRGQPPCRGRDFHLKLTERQLAPPMFFRTDEAGPGSIVELQSPGCGWEMAEQVRDVYRRFPEHFGAPSRPSASLSERVAAQMRGSLGAEPVVHHLVNNASRPHGVHYFVQRLREHGVRHFGWDRDVVGWRDCTLVRAHEFYDLRYNGFFDQWMDACDQGALRFDHPPTPLYDAKVVMAWPFWDRTRDYYPDESRALFPYTAIITPDGFPLADGEWAGLDEYCAMGAGKRSYYFKFGSAHPTLNWGSRAVYHSGSLSAAACRRMFDRILADHAEGHHWVVQRACRHVDPVTALTRRGEEISMTAHTKLSGYYGPEGLIAVMVMHERSRKVHGSVDTALSIVY
ncbi:hypothetical protein [Spirillospora sp. CA-294931]|uniref:hypothetical protein n=1 Tax=Spirillospora sp. CA-294931 TaxID=3240042 RepID=UPI003D934625